MLSVDGGSVGYTIAASSGSGPSSRIIWGMGFGVVKCLRGAIIPLFEQGELQFCHSQPTKAKVNYEY